MKTNFIIIEQNIKEKKSSKQKVIIVAVVTVLKLPLINSVT